MKIAFLSFYSGAVDRGVEVATQALAKGLAKEFSTTVFQSGERACRAPGCNSSVTRYNFPKA